MAARTRREFCGRSDVAGCRSAVRLLYSGWLQMTLRLPTIFLLVAFFSAQMVGTAVCKSAVAHAVFKAKNGSVIEWSTRSGILRTPYSRHTTIHDCSDILQSCLTDHHGFAFSYFRRCNDADADSYKNLKFTPKSISVLHNNIWLVFDASPNYMFHYVIPRGIVGIYVGRTSSYDFRNIFHDRNFRLDKIDAREYRISGSDGIAGCND